MVSICKRQVIYVVICWGNFMMIATIYRTAIMIISNTCRSVKMIFAL
jgi:hypothetical protein